ncbi:SusE domain-containing protein [Mucilaginibacter sp.]|uniref:SusE domain-containing protein n=1 Tax=Mucilaginibacter sp. TaxID=1882438 RepID=UPI003D14033E
MKTIIKLSFMVMIAIIAFTSCKKDQRALDTSVAPVTALSLPADQASLTLQPATGNSIVFQWTPSTTQDLVLYEVAFDKPGGDFSKPVYKVLSDGAGIQPQATITQKVLNTIASLAGIASSSTGSLKWAVIVSKVTNNKVSTASHIIQLTRPAGFAVLPASLYLTGTATEQGTDVTKAIAFKKISDGVFELYTSLQAGSYTLVDKNSGTPTMYSIQNNANVVLNGSTTVSGNKNVYRISIDLNSAAATITQIVSVGFWSAPDGKIWFTLPYIGNSQWEMDNYPLIIPHESYGNDSRYKYQFTVINSAGTQSVEWYGSVNSDNQDPSSSTPLSYYYMYPVDNSQFNYCFKIDPSDNNKNVNVNVNYSPALSNYTNSITAK